MSTHWIILPFVVLTISCCCCLPFLSAMQPLELGSAAPDFSLPSLSGETVSLADFAGRPVLLCFWSPY